MTDEVTPTREQCVEWVNRQRSYADNSYIYGICDAILSHLRTARAEAGDAQFPDFSCDDDGAFTIEWYIDNRNVLSISPEGDSLNAAWMVDGVGGSRAWELCTPTPKEVVGAYYALSRRPSEAVDVVHLPDNCKIPFTSGNTAAPSRRLTAEEREALDYAAGVCDMHAKNKDGIFRPIGRCKVIGGYRDILRALASEDAAAVGEYEFDIQVMKDAHEILADSAARHAAVAASLRDALIACLSCLPDKCEHEREMANVALAPYTPSPPEGGRT